MQHWGHLSCVCIFWGCLLSPSSHLYHQWRMQVTIVENVCCIGFLMPEIRLCFWTRGPQCSARLSTRRGKCAWLVLVCWGKFSSSLRFARLSPSGVAHFPFSTKQASCNEALWDSTKKQFLFLISQNIFLSKRRESPVTSGYHYGVEEKSNSLQKQ